MKNNDGVGPSMFERRWNEFYKTYIASTMEIVENSDQDHGIMALFETLRYVKDGKHLKEIVFTPEAFSDMVNLLNSIVHDGLKEIETEQERSNGWMRTATSAKSDKIAMARKIYELERQLEDAGKKCCIEPTVLYECDRIACDTCHPSNFCHNTSDIRHAKNFVLIDRNTYEEVKD